MYRRWCSEHKFNARPTRRRHTIIADQRVHRKPKSMLKPASVRFRFRCGHPDQNRESRTGLEEAPLLRFGCRHNREQMHTQSRADAYTIDSRYIFLTYPYLSLTHFRPILTYPQHMFNLSLHILNIFLTYPYLSLTCCKPILSYP